MRIEIACLEGFLLVQMEGPRYSNDEDCTMMECDLC